MKGTQKIIGRISCLIIAGMMICSLTSCALLGGSPKEGCTLHLNLRYAGTLPKNMDIYVDGSYVWKIPDPKRPNPLALQRGLHKIRIASEEHNLEGLTEIYILGKGKEQILRVDIIKIKSES